MIVHPKIGQHARVWYRKSVAATNPNHGKVGIVTRRSKGPGPRNHAVEIEGVEVVVPCGNLQRLEALCTA